MHCCLRDWRQEGMMCLHPAEWAFTAPTVCTGYRQCSLVLMNNIVTGGNSSLCKRKANKQKTKTHKKKKSFSWWRVSAPFHPPDDFVNLKVACCLALLFVPLRSSSLNLFSTSPNLPASEITRLPITSGQRRTNDFSGVGETTTFCPVNACPRVMRMDHENLPFLRWPPGPACFS